MEQANLTLGDIVRIKEKSPAGGGELAYVYETYSDFDVKGELGVSLITQSGRDTGGWSRQEQAQFLEYVGHSGWDYEFKNVIQLSRDFDAGVFNHVFDKSKPAVEQAPAQPEAQCGKGWSNRCRVAKGKKCNCRCGGANHGKANQQI